MTSKKKSLLFILVLSLTVLCYTFASAESFSITTQPESHLTLDLGQDSIQVNVKENVKLLPSIVGDGEKRNPKYEWTSSDDKVATVQGGNIRGISPGTAIVTCTATIEELTLISVCSTTPFFQKSGAQST